jgi:hypothetical protein
LGHHPFKVERPPAVAAQTVGVQFVVMGVQPRDAAEVDHGLIVGSAEAQGLSLDATGSHRVAGAIYFSEWLSWTIGE